MANLVSNTSDKLFYSTHGTLYDVFSNWYNRFSLLFLCTAIALIPSPNLKIYVWLFLLALFVQMQFEPLGDHIQPQFIAILLLCFQKESSHYKSEDSYFNDTPISFFGIFGNSQCSNSQYNKE